MKIFTDVYTQCVQILHIDRMGRKHKHKIEHIPAKAPVCSTRKKRHKKKEIKKKNRTEKNYIVQTLSQSIEYFLSI